jgi:hypothetical protein
MAFDQRGDRDFGGGGAAAAAGVGAGGGGGATGGGGSYEGGGFGRGRGKREYSYRCLPQFQPFLNFVWAGCLIFLILCFGSVLNTHLPRPMSYDLIDLHISLLSFLLILWVYLRIPASVEIPFTGDLALSTTSSQPTNIRRRRTCNRLWIDHVTLDAQQTTSLQGLIPG